MGWDTWPKGFYDAAPAYVVCGRFLRARADRSNCAGGYLEGKEASVVATDGSGWRRFLLSNYAVLATTQSALVYFSVGVQGPFDTSIALVADHLGFGPANTFTDLLFKNGFE